ncbi:MAG: hypothetical protein A2023_03185 [Sulfuricurvum sp. GWF2_44_89]|uniref:Uncharacterized protein n=1 Tax=Sulfuricurvum kujiense TaxID=148813 RepID=A0A2D3W8W1_9BACT|nr:MULTISPECIES: hypothetical protein [Sulfuricurvum]OHD77312.1 MAG: hypothetical protein A2023_03185 [Sulfuricurvum sp. GWF2_44_89]OHD91366.1 MAG: hypothetical protein A2517_10145 [Sulfuricurvum sp. RIFOXYD12_FULL_44_77]OHD92762.1 MAG: hypothetical protein A2552_07510 [Sulfuricurvum sp. RIFOXYD2_FULL_44_160]DAB37771.1 MAG TPA: hypothetical protein CFH83_09460 [Sulfuricurvum kujiense]
MNYEVLSGKSVLLLGKTRALNSDEFDTLLKLHKITRVESYSEDVALIIEGRMMNPYEQGESARLYETQRAPIVDLSSVEEWLCRSIEPNRLLMSLKLSRNQERLVDFLQNPYITDELFFKLLKLYDWRCEGLFDNDANRDVTAAIIGRFYVDLDRNHNVQYAMSGLAHLIERYGNPELIHAITELSPIANEIKNSNDRSLIGVLDAIALHPDTQENILRLLLEERAGLLAHREPLALESELLALQNEELNSLLAQNATLSREGALQLESAYPHLIASKTLLNEDRFGRLLENYAVNLAANPSLTPAMQQKLYSLNDDRISGTLASNPITLREILDHLFERGEFSASLASNPSLSHDKLELLATSTDADVLVALASNMATPIETLYQLSLDRRFERAVKTNPTFGKHIQTHNIGWF